MESTHCAVAISCMLCGRQAALRINADCQSCADALQGVPQQATDTLLQGQRLLQSIRAQVQHQSEGWCCGPLPAHPMALQHRNNQ